MKLITFLSCVQLEVGPTHIELKFEDTSLEGMGFILNGLNYNSVGPMMEFMACVTHSGVLIATGNPNF